MPQHQQHQGQLQERQPLQTLSPSGSARPLWRAPTSEQVLSPRLSPLSPSRDLIPAGATPLLTPTSTPSTIATTAIITPSTAGGSNLVLFFLSDLCPICVRSFRAPPPWLLRALSQMRHSDKSHGDGVVILVY